MRFAVLGTLRVCDDQDTELTPHSPMVRTLLAALLLTPNRAVSLERLEDLLWGDRPPASARASLHNHVARLRRALGDASRVLSRDGGLVVRVEPGELDAERLVRAPEEARRARSAGDWARVARVTEEALALWRGAPLAELPALADRAASETSRWQEARLQTLELWLDAGAELGRQQELLPELRRVTREFPLREAFHAHLLLALHGTGRRSEALEAYHDLRRALADALGIEPGPAVRAAFQRILEDAPPAPAAAPPPPVSVSVAVSTAPAQAVPEPPAVPMALPRDPVSFTGREPQLQELIREIREETGPGGPPASLRVHAVDGMPGVGKTAFALRVAHQVRDAYPDGQIFLPLHAHTAGTPPLAPEDALAELLLAAGESPQRVPDGLAARAGAWRSRIAGRRMLIVLDDATGSDQIEPLLPGTPGCLILVTSRRRLEALTGARPLTLGLLSEEEAVRLLSTRSGRPDVTGDDPSVARLARMCGRLPLALNLVAARLRHRRHWTPADLADDLGSAAGGPAALAAENVSVAAAFDLSYRDLTAGARTLLRRVGLLPGTDLDLHAAAALLGSGLAATRPLVDELCDRHLVEEPVPGRFQTHDLVREYARGLGRTDDPAQCEEAVGRLMAHYLHAATDASLRIARHRAVPPPLTAPRPAELPAFADAYRATAWLRAEHANLRAALAHAARDGAHEVTVRLSAALHDFLRSDGHWEEARTTHRSAVKAARRSGDRLGEAVAQYQLSLVGSLQGRYEEAEEGMLRALGLVRALGDRGREGMVLYGLGRVLRLTGRYEEAAGTLDEALRRLGDAGDDLGEGAARVEHGHVLQLTGRYAQAATALEAALDVFEDAGDTLGLANARAGLADICRSLGRYERAAEHHRHALGLYRGLGNRLGEANVLTDLGDVLLLTGAYDQAADALAEAVGKQHGLGSRLGEAQALTYLGRVHLRRGDAGRAEDVLARARTLCTEVNSAIGTAYVSLAEAEAVQLRGDHVRAGEAAEECAARFRELGDPGGETAAVHLHARALRAAGSPGRALDRHREALGLATRLQAPYEEMLAATGVADCLTDLGTPEDAVPHLRRARDLAERLGVPEAEDLRGRLAGRS
ncbi:BTAD domain-containing putative transcriptional regulator [Streptomyces griseus]|uniref:AfsR/SARP family transcriptional regulator n=1 Tax=Streptomyces griseus TaxID=1911 RepID=UPI000AF8C79D|nr:BTAD domain-containing putative transcriptional regulator [Streptomyces griseus]